MTCSRFATEIFHQLCKGISVCGDENLADRLSLLVDVTIPHSGPELRLAFGSSLTHQKHPCEASFGFDDVSLRLL